MKLIIAGDNTYIHGQVGWHLSKSLEINIPESDRTYNMNEKCHVVHTQHLNKVLRLLKCFNYQDVPQIQVNTLDELRLALGENAASKQETEVAKPKTKIRKKKILY